MDGKHNGVPEREKRLDEVVAAYFQAVEAGQPPDRQELLVRHADLLPELAQFFEDADALGGLALRPRSVRPAAVLDGEVASETIAASQELGDFRIVREVGKGGMGIVYEAEQVSLRRRVALKVLPFAATMDPRHLQRFRNEAQAAACLHHTNIVPVFFVGCERGVHFYAMQFIDGQPLSALIRWLMAADKTPAPGGEGTVAYQPPPGEAAPTPLLAAELTPRTGEGRRSRAYFRKVAELGIQAAEALDHAHQLGIVHRDIKPGNLMLDGRGNLWVTDFGLAQIQHGEANLTLTGQALGTPRYMSPEQALAKRVPIDHRTDVYSLGVTLYELLTLRPAFVTKDRHELLRQIAFEDPPPPRRLERAVPAELETIVLKAMEKRPQDRYATAKELADDLERWLKHEPIRARRSSWLQVVRKWMRRHQTVVWATSFLLLVLMIVGIVNAWWWMQQQEEAAKKHTAAVTEAGAALQEAQRWQQDERWSEALGAIRRAQATLHVLEADTKLRQQVDELGKDLEMAQRLEEARLQTTMVKDAIFNLELQEAAYAAAFMWYGLDLEQGDVDAAVEFIRSRSINMQLVAALDHWAFAQRARKCQKWKHLLDVARAADPDELQNRMRDAWERGDDKAMVELLTSAEVEKLLPETIQLLNSSYLFRKDVPVKRVVSLLRQLQQRHPADFWINFHLGQIHGNTEPPQLEEAISYYRAALALRPQSQGVHNNLGRMLARKDQLDEAIAEFREAIRLQKDFAGANYNLGHALHLKGQWDEAIAEYRKAIRLGHNNAEAHINLGSLLCDVKHDWDGAIAEFREAIRLNGALPDPHYNLGVALYHKGDLDEAIAEYREAIRLNRDLPNAHHNLGIALKDKGHLEEAISEYREAIRIKKDLPDSHFSLGAALYRKGRLDEAITHYREAIRIKEDHAMAHNGLGVALRDKGQVDEAIAEYREAIRIREDFAYAHNNLGVVLSDAKNDYDGGATEFQIAIRIDKDYTEAHVNLGQALLRKGQFAKALNSFRRSSELALNNPRLQAACARWMRKCERMVKLDGKLPAILSGQKLSTDTAEGLELAQLCQMPYKKLYWTATRFYIEAFADKPQLADDLNSQHRYNAACAAALASCSQGKDADKLDAKERAGRRQQALDWLRADLKAYRQVLEKSAGKAGPEIAQRMLHWLQDSDFAGLRGSETLAKLPEAERKGWHKLWQEVEALRQQAGQLPKTASSARP